MWGYLDNLELSSRLQSHLISALKSEDVDNLGGRLEGILAIVLQQVSEDLQAYTARDPASRGRMDLVVEAYASFQAVLFYRLSHQIWLSHDIPGREIIAHKLASMGKLHSGAEIHPAACIGKRFVLDHGFGTVIGETCEIGDDCYVLCGVTLGASGIADNNGGKRHPKLGNRVEVGAGARILGSISIGDNVFISPSCVVTRDVPPDSHVSIVNQLQLKRDKGFSRRMFVGAFALGDRLHLVGELSEKDEVALVDADHQHLGYLTLECTVRERYHHQYRVRHFEPLRTDLRFPLSLKLLGPSQDITLLDPPGLRDLIQAVLKPNIVSVGG
ncbi:serine O-acetyltransferase [Allohahella marinimesophila]|uniref:serine O-acetyltransferase n=1 Tax=Allohahella marinimesophila TaxID=1054972 RepID=A0ABP7NFP7_9GAMM